MYVPLLVWFSPKFGWSALFIFKLIEHSTIPVINFSVAVAVRFPFPALHTTLLLRKLHEFEIEPCSNVKSECREYEGVCVSEALPAKRARCLPQQQPRARTSIVKYMLFEAIEGEE
jgi:hypothetical protein